MADKIVTYGGFEWDVEKCRLNLQKHHVDFFDATVAFYDVNRIIATDEAHCAQEPRFFCLGLVDVRVMTVRFTHRHHKIRIIGAGYWRKGKKFYEKELKKKNHK